MYKSTTPHFFISRHVWSCVVGKRFVVLGCFFPTFHTFLCFYSNFFLHDLSWKFDKLTDEETYRSRKVRNKNHISDYGVGMGVRAGVEMGSGITKKNPYHWLLGKKFLDSGVKHYIIISFVNNWADYFLWSFPLPSLQRPSMRIRLLPKDLSRLKVSSVLFHFKWLVLTSCC